MSKKKVPFVFESNGYARPHFPDNGKDFTLKELQQIVGGTIDIKKLPKDTGIMVLNDEGMLLGLPENKEATKIWKRNYPISKYPINNVEFIVGNVLVCPASMVR